MMLGEYDPSNGHKRKVYVTKCYTSNIIMDLPSLHTTIATQTTRACSTKRSHGVLVDRQRHSHDQNQPRSRKGEVASRLAKDDRQ